MPEPTHYADPRRHWLQDPQSYAVDQERTRHMDALYRYGEYAVVVLMWNALDEAAGRIGRCSRCYLTMGKVAEAYGQASQTNCPVCYGTSFEGGYKALLYRPTLWDTSDTHLHEGSRGEVNINAASIQSTPDHRLNKGDYVFRADGTRWQIRTLSSSDLHTGFEHSDNPRQALAFNYGQAGLEDESSVAYLIPPDAATLRQRLDLTNSRVPVDWESLDEIKPNAVLL